MTTNNNHIVEELRDRLRHCSQDAKQQQQQHQASPLLPPSASSATVSGASSHAATPAISTRASDANLVGLDREERHRRRRERRLRNPVDALRRHLSVDNGKDGGGDVTLPMPALPPIEQQKAVCRKTVSALARIPALLLLLFVFICSLDLLSTAFRLLAGKAAGSVFQSSELLTNPVVGLMIGVIFTVLVQSSSTCTSVIVSMVSSGILDVRTAIPMIMGANVGTSLTSTLVSLTQMRDRGEFELAFAGATVHDCFNWLTVAALLTLETTTGYLYHLTGWLTSNGDQWMAAEEKAVGGAAKKINILGALTKPVTKRIVQIDKAVLKCWGLGECQEERLLRVWCQKPLPTPEVMAEVEAVARDYESGSQDQGEAAHKVATLMTHVSGKKCEFLMNVDGLSDQAVGAILLAVSLLVLTLCLVLIVKVLRSLLQGAVATLIKKTINADIPYLPWLTGYLAIFAGAVLTFVVQSSSVFTSTLTPLVGVGLITVDRVYPLTLGSNLGTTTTALLAAAAAEPGPQLRNSVQIALCHMFFNLSGILLFYPVPFMRWPLGMCKALGRTTAKYRWFAVFYLATMFLVAPAAVLTLSIVGGTEALVAVLAPAGAIAVLAVVVSALQDKCPKVLPTFMRDWKFLPLWMRSLEPLDGLITRLACMRISGYQPTEGEEHEGSEDGQLRMRV